MVPPYRIRFQASERCVKAAAGTLPARAAVYFPRKLGRRGLKRGAAIKDVAHLFCGAKEDRHARDRIMER